MKQRLQKLLSAQGFCSRRTAETWIAKGRVKVNGMVAQLGDSADLDTDTVTVDDVPLVAEAPGSRYIMLNKPRGYLCTMVDARGRKTVIDLLDGVSERVFPVGRLDRNSEGMLLLTNDGDFAFRLTHPSHEVDKQYLLTLSAPPCTEENAPHIRLSEPMQIDGQTLLPARCQFVSKQQDRYQLRITIREGKNRQIRKMCEHLGYTVLRLKRLSVGSLRLGGLLTGQWRDLTAKEVEELRNTSPQNG